MILLGFAVAMTAPACPAPTGEHVVTLGLATRGHSFAGLAVIDFAAEAWTLTALSPAGPELFTATYASGQTVVTSAFDAWSPLLSKLPFDRDLRLLHTRPTETCSVGSSRVVPRGSDWVWRGTPGPARVTTRGDGARVLSDPWRGYTLTVLDAEVPR